MATQHHWTNLIVGLGQTGLSVAYYLARQGIDFAVVDSRENPPGKAELMQTFPNVVTAFGAFKAELFMQAERLIVSPGVAVATSVIQQAKQQGAEIIGDIELFVREANAPIIAITGSNGKSTVTTLVAEMAEQAGWRVYAGGNLGTTSLDLLQKPAADLYVMELSSFQLETTTSLQAVSSVILNLCEDHMDRYDHFDDYVAAKQVIFKQSQLAVINRDDALVKQLTPKSTSISFGLDVPRSGHYGLQDGYLMKGKSRLMHSSHMKVQGRHNIANALSALALGEAANIPMDAMLKAIAAFTGLAHRTQWVAEINGVQWFNDSKGTNVGATIAALSGLSGKTVLIAGGQGKGADFSPLIPIISAKARAVVLIGEDSHTIAAVIESQIPIVYAESMQQAVALSVQLAQHNDNVLLSPACASFDMFKSYIHRGEVFMDAVRSLPI
jgi:UDP-N-acetylmuramoylalanine--D-glutamate ligase